MESIIDELFDEIDNERTEQILQGHINFAHKNKWGFDKFKILLNVNLNLEQLPEDKRWEEDDFVREYHKFVVSMSTNKKTFTIQKYLHEFYNVAFCNFHNINYIVNYKPVENELPHTTGSTHTGATN